jgi:beta-N-acetylhexosaminidase
MTVMLIRWVIVLVLFIIALNLKSPYLFNYRQFETIGILSVCLACAWIVFRQSPVKTTHNSPEIYFRVTEKRLFLAILAIVFALTCAGEMSFQYRKYAVLHTDKKTLQELGKHFIVGYTEIEHILPLISSGAVGGIFITHRNVRNKSFEQIRKEIKDLQKIRKSAGLAPLMIAADQEGGIVSRLSPPLTALPPLSSLISKNSSLEEVKENALKYGEIHGKELSELGVNVNLAPVADLNFQKDDNPMDFHTHIRRRAISDDEMLVSRAALAYSRGIEKYGVIPTVKHFPGIGRVSSDTHHFSAELSTDKKELQQKDWIPFKHVLENSGAFMMLAHVILPKIDPEHPVSHSYKIIQGIIREDWKHDGVLITDDLTMGAIYSSKTGIRQAAVMALNAGMDLLLISYDGEKYYEVMYRVIQAYQDKTLDVSMLEKSSRRLGRVLKFYDTVRTQN